MKARFIGDPLDDHSGPRTLRLFGLTFQKGVWASIPSELDRKISGNSHFETAADDADVTDATVDEIEGRQSASDPLDQDGDGEPGGSTSSPEKDAIIAQLEAIAQRGAEKGVEVKFDRRWGVPKLQAALEAAEFEVGED